MLGGWLVAAVLSAASPAVLAQDLVGVDLSGTWGQLMHEDRAERGAGPDFADYTGLPINDAARLRAESWDAAKWTVPEHQCEPHPLTTHRTVPRTCACGATSTSPPSKSSRGT
jgi:hypothetical protein